MTALTSDEQQAIDSSCGRALVDRFWGNYVAFLTPMDARPCSIVRAPLGSLPCYMLHERGSVWVASDLSLLLSTQPARPRVDWPALARQMAAPEIRRQETCLVGISELQGGERLIINEGGIETESLWSPWTAVAAQRAISDRRLAAAHVAEAVRLSVAGQGAQSNHALLKLSGGLDSSIVAAAISAAGSRLTCVTFVTSDAGGDERSYAQCVARHLGVPLIEAERNPASIDVTRSLAAGLPRPTARSFNQESSRIERQVAADVGADLLVDGGGGDNVFCSLQSVAPVADLLRTTGFSRDVLRTATSLSLQTGTSILPIMRRAVRRAWWRAPDYRWPLRFDYLSCDARAVALDASAHPWLTPPPGSLPGTAAHVALLVAAQSWIESQDAEEELPSASPLLAQPAVEACLRVPSWLWLDGGCNRAVARRAFAGNLPPEIVSRRSKGSPDGFVAAILARNRPALCAMLLEGRLMAAGILDRGAIAEALAYDRPVRDFSFARIMQLADAEAWAGAWC